jgi:hypothetical protein
MYLKVKSYHLRRHGESLAFVLVKIHPFTLKLKAIITLHNGEEHELKNQWATEEEFDLEIEKFVNQRLNAFSWGY